ncbi:MAG: hypothetical protein KGJ57_21145 [Sphingomonadales bacterium]|nr:hypothetical protein [Sphingomonadales bacterium]MDE2171903.1 hypothetical protein [Sphingomonadales bacterium]
MAMLTISTPSWAGIPLTPASIRMDIRRSGAKAVVERLFSSGRYDLVMSRMRSGSAAWVLLAKPLSIGTDAASSEELQQALTYALPKSPEAVLSILDASGSSVPRSPANVCSASFFEGDRTDIPAYRAEAARAVRAVRVPTLQIAKAACLKILTKK